MRLLSNRRQRITDSQEHHAERRSQAQKRTHRTLPFISSQKCKTDQWRRNYEQLLSSEGSEVGQLSTGERPGVVTTRPSVVVWCSRPRALFMT